METASLQRVGGVTFRHSKSRDREKAPLSIIGARILIKRKTYYSSRDVASLLKNLNDKDYYKGLGPLDLDETYQNAE